MKFILPNFYNNFIEVMNSINKYHGNKGININGVYGSFFGSYFNGGINTITDAPACLLQHMEGCLREYRMLDTIIIDFGNPLISEYDFLNRFAAIQFESFSNQKNIFFAVGHPKFIDYIVKHYPSSQIIVHHNLIDEMSSIEEIEKLVKTHSNIKGIISSDSNKLDAINCDIKILYIPLYTCNQCNHWRKCKENEWKAILEFSTYSDFYKCKRYKEIPFSNENFRDINKDYIILLGEPQSKIEDYMELITEYIEGIGGYNND
jgi:hypothetical protein